MKMQFMNKVRVVSAGVLFAAVAGAPIISVGALNPHAEAQSSYQTGYSSTGTTSTTSSTGTSGTSTTSGDTTMTTSGSTDTTSTGANANKSVEKRNAANVKREDAKLRACQNREKVINNITSRIADRGQKQLDLFTSIATKTEAFYVNKGKTLSNYDALVADVNAKQAAAATTVAAIKAKSTTFTCNSSDPKAEITSFKDSLKLEIAALKEYKTAVKNLIVGVKSVESTTAGTNTSTHTKATTTTTTTQGGN